MTNARKILWSKKQDPQFHEFLELEKAKSNALGIQGLSFGLFLIFLLPGLGLDLIINLKVLSVGGPKIHLIIFHLTALVLNVISYVIATRFLRQLKTGVFPPATRKKFVMFSMLYPSVMLMVGITRSLLDQLDTSHLLFYVLALNLIVATIHLHQRISLFILIPPMLFAWVLNFLYADGYPFILVSFIGWSFAITVGAYVANSLLYNNLIERVLQKEVNRLQNLSLLKSNESKDRILGMVAHDLRTPVANIDQLIEFISHPTTSEAEQKQFYALIKQSCDQAFNIIADILESSGSNKTEMQKVPTDLNILIEKVLKVQASNLAHKQLDVHFNKQGTAVIADIDPSKIERVIDNLISNAIKFTANQGKVEVSCYLQANHACLKVQDSGIGIPEKMLPYIFEPFSKARRKGLDGEKTVGLGLSIVKNIVELHGGKISVDSVDHQGTTIEISLPVR
ncbi:MAG: two-component sensor histidine kinase [Segetibacter sp.]|nr:two-component sensor histidine kinase [Segetibacter sp.]